MIASRGYVGRPGSAESTQNVEQSAKSLADSAGRQTISHDVGAADERTAADDSYNRALDVLLIDFVQGLEDELVEPILHRPDGN